MTPAATRLLACLPPAALVRPQLITGRHVEMGPPRAYHPSPVSSLPGPRGYPLQAGVISAKAHYSRALRLTRMNDAVNN